jgi:hypothetical protein
MVLGMTNGTTDPGGGGVQVATGLLAGQEITCFYETRKYAPSLFNSVSVFTPIFPRSILILTSHLLHVPVSLVLHVTGSLVSRNSWYVCAESQPPWFYHADNVTQRVQRARIVHPSVTLWCGPKYKFTYKVYCIIWSEWFQYFWKWSV